VRTVASTYLQSIYNTCLTNGVRAEDLLPLIPGGAQFLTAPETRMPIDTVIRVLTAAEQHTKMPEIGLLAGEAFRPSTFLNVGHAIMFCSTLRHVILLIRRYQPLIQQFGRTNLQIFGTEAHVCWHSFYADAEYCRNVTDAVMSSHAQFGRWLTWVHDKKINAIHFRHKKPSYAKLYEDMFECPILFDQPLDKMIVDVAAIDMPLPQANEDMHRNICAQLDVLLDELMNTSTLQTTISRYLRLHLAKGAPTLKVVAHHVGISERGLRRKLTQQNTSYRDILEQTRRALCEQYLFDGQYNLNEIAEKLGYAEQSSFSRAFKSWFGESPKTYIRAMALFNTAFTQMAP